MELFNMTGSKCSSVASLKLTTQCHCGCSIHLNKWQKDSSPVDQHITQTKWLSYTVAFSEPMGEITIHFLSAWGGKKVAVLIWLKSQQICQQIRSYRKVTFLEIVFLLLSQMWLQLTRLLKKIREIKIYTFIICLLVEQISDLSIRTGMSNLWLAGCKWPWTTSNMALQDCNKGHL